MSDADALDYPDTREGWAQRWTAEIKAAQETIEPWHMSAEKCIDAYLDDKTREGQRLNLFPSNVNTSEATLYGKPPTVDVERKFNDSTDDDGRVSAEILQRVLNGDIERPEDLFARGLRNSLRDWLRVGYGNLWQRYERETEPTEGTPAKTEPVLDEFGQPTMDEQGQPATKILAEAIPPGEKVTSEDVVSEYVYWKDELWSPARTFDEIRWRGKRKLLSQPTAEKKFGEKLPLSIGADGQKGTDDKEPKTPWARAEVWELWDKETACVWWWCKGHPRMLVPKGVKANPNGSIPDPFGLQGFWPAPEPLVSNLTTSKYLPRADYALQQDIYKAIDDKTERIGILSDAIAAKGVFDKTVGELAMLIEGKGNKLIPAANYVQLAEKGGIAACIAWLPLEPIVNAMEVLRDLRREDIQLLFQASGHSDIERGQASSPGTTATEQAIKAKYGSIRGQRAQDEFARFASDCQRIRGEIVCRLFAPETIIERANVQGLNVKDQARVPAALEILRSRAACYRIVVKPESISLTDYAANKQESMDVLGTIATFVQATQGLPPQAIPTLLQMLQVFLARVKGGEAIEGILDEAIEQAQQMAQQAAQTPPPPDPKLQTAQVKAGAEQFRAKADVVQTGLDLQQSQAEHSMNMQKLEAEQRGEALKVIAGVAQPQQGAPA